MVSGYTIITHNISNWLILSENSFFTSHYVWRDLNLWARPKGIGPNRMLYYNKWCCSHRYKHPCLWWGSAEKILAQKNTTPTLYTTFVLDRLKNVPKKWSATSWHLRQSVPIFTLWQLITALGYSPNNATLVRLSPQGHDATLFKR